jgi:hypothetical protein
MGIFDEAEKAVGQDKIQEATQEAEKFADKETGDKFDSEISSAGTALDSEIAQQEQQQ